MQSVVKIFTLCLCLIAWSCDTAQASALRRRVARSPAADDIDIEGIIPSETKKDAPTDPASTVSASDNHNGGGDLLNTLTKGLGLLRASPVADDSLKTDIDEFQKEIRSGRLNSTFEEVRKDVSEAGAAGERPSISRILDSFSEKAPESFRAIISRIEKAVRDAFQSLLSSGSKARAQVEDTLRSAFTTVLDTFGR